MQITCTKVVDPTPESIKKIVDVLEDAFSKYQYHRLACGGDASLMRLHLECHVEAALVDCEVWTASCGQDEIGCVAIWTPPGKSLREGPGKEEFFQRFDKALPAYLKAWKEKEIGALRAAKNDQVNVDKSRDWHLSVLGTVPSMRRRGLASALIKTLIDRVNQENGTITLTTEAWSTAEKVYQPFGFEVVFAGTIRYLNGESDPYIGMKYGSP